jgi:CubicO group peptidase (beta-lactamase class C family)
MATTLRIGAALLAIILLLVLLGVALVAVRVETAPELPQPSDAVVYADRYAEAARASTAIMATQMDATGFPSASIAAGVNGELVWTLAMGWADLDSAVPAAASTRYRVGSVAKSFTAAALGVLADQQKLDLDDEFQRWVPDLPAKDHTFSLRDLASHQAGVRHYRGGIAGLTESFHQTQYDTVRDALVLVEDDPLLFEPGTAYQYSSYGYNMLSLALERAAGMPYLELMRLTVFEPLGMKATGPDRRDDTGVDVAVPYLVYDGNAIRAPGVNNSYKWAGGGFLSTPTDMVAFGNGLLDDRIVTTATRAQLWTPQRFDDGSANPDHYGLGFRVLQTDDGRHVSHGGSSIGGSAYLVILPKKRIVVGFATNSTAYSPGHDVRADIDAIARLFAASRTPAPGVRLPRAAPASSPAG